ncbi:Dynein axonemal assembly factor 1 homolog [Nesidiocoris tenuis]|uniref:Dynein axonemal assembly factor 1 homolog n=1 Tax=Nesidiocoris tenuis TaxID=355587 RepID=A0ABN7AIM2_9HEMI|nr:Dynein axonemal assembly factor 1 homolog [Nesidiocoris tenuis]
MPELDTINLCHNFIPKIENLDCLSSLTSLHMTHNHLTTSEDIEHLKQCHCLSTVDLSHNRLDDPAIVGVFSSMPNLRVLVLTGNPVRNKVKYYRKTMIVECKTLTYLDERPIFDVDREAIEAWASGGNDAEEAVRQAHRDKEMKRIRDSVYALINMRNRARNSHSQDDASSYSSDEGPEYNSEQKQLFEVFDREIDEEEGKKDGDSIKESELAVVGGDAREHPRLIAELEDQAEQLDKEAKGAGNIVRLGIRQMGAGEAQDAYQDTVLNILDGQGHAKDDEHSGPEEHGVSGKADNDDIGGSQVIEGTKENSNGKSEDVVDSSESTHSTSDHDEQRYSSAEEILKRGIDKNEPPPKSFTAQTKSSNDVKRAEPDCEVTIESDGDTYEFRDSDVESTASESTSDEENNRFVDCTSSICIEAEADIKILDMNKECQHPENLMEEVKDVDDENYDVEIKQECPNHPEKIFEDNILVKEEFDEIVKLLDEPEMSFEARHQLDPDAINGTKSEVSTMRDGNIQIENEYRGPLIESFLRKVSQMINDPGVEMGADSGLTIADEPLITPVGIEENQPNKSTIVDGNESETADKHTSPAKTNRTLLVEEIQRENQDFCNGRGEIDDDSDAVSNIFGGKNSIKLGAQHLDSFTIAGLIGKNSQVPADASDSDSEEEICKLEQEKPSRPLIVEMELMPDEVQGVLCPGFDPSKVPQQTDPMSGCDSATKFIRPEALAIDQQCQPSAMQLDSSPTENEINTKQMEQVRITLDKDYEAVWTTEDEHFVVERYNPSPSQDLKSAIEENCSK